jgi:hypothetical protein
MKKFILVAGISAIAAGCASLATGPGGVNWDKVPATKVALFYPGQSSYQWLRDETKHKGASKETARGDACTSCHDDPTEEATQGAKILGGKHPLEPHAGVLKGKNGHIDMTVQAAYDDKNAYLRFQWQTNNKNHPGNDYPGYRFDGKEWKSFGGMRLDKNVLAGKTPVVYENRLSIMLDDGKVPGFANQGCWQTCHDGERDMQKEPTRAEVEANPLMKAIKKSDVRKYIPATRTDPISWASGKSVEEIAKLKADGQFLDLMQWRAHRSASVNGSDDGFVLEYRNTDKGTNFYGSNMDSKTKQPKFMFDPAKFGSKAFTAGDYGKKEMILVNGVNAVPFDPNAGWKEGDMLPQYVLDGAAVAGSVADNRAYSSWKHGVQTVVLVRPLGLPHDDDKALKAGGVYSVGFAVHDDNMTGRGHHVSYVKTLGLGVKADIQAVRLN